MDISKLENTLKVAYMNILGQSGLEYAKQVQIESFLKTYKLDILHLQESNISEDTFNNCDFINSSYNIISNNASNKYGTTSLISSCLQPENIKFDSEGRVIVFDIGNMTFSNVYLPSGNDPHKKNMRENYSAEIIPKLLINSKSEGIVGGDWNCITRDADATRNQAQKMSSSLKRVIKTFSWSDSFLCLHPNSNIYSRYYGNTTHGDGATRIDRQYHWGNITVISATYIGVAFSDHHALVLELKIPASFSQLLSPKYRPQFKSKPEVIRDQEFNIRLKKSMAEWEQVKLSGGLISCSGGSTWLSQE